MIRNELSDLLDTLQRSIASSEISDRCQTHKAFWSAVDEPMAEVMEGVETEEDEAFVEGRYHEILGLADDMGLASPD